MSDPGRPPRHRFLGWAVFALAIFLIGAFVPPMFQTGVTPILSAAFMLESASAGPLPQEWVLVVHPMQLRPGQHVADGMLHAGLTGPEVGRALHALGGATDIRRVRPADKFYLYTSSEGELKRVEYEQRLSESRIVVQKTDEAFVASVEKKPVDRYLRKIKGTVQDNLFFSVQRAGGNAALVVNFADLFAWDFDFFTETRKGDQFEMLVEEKVVDGVPAGFGRILAGTYHPAGAEKTLDAYYFAWAENAESGYYTGEGRSVRKFFLKSPLNFKRISSHFTNSRFHPILKKHRPHLGIDYAAPTGTPVVALGNGRVIFAGTKGGYGKTVQVKHNQTYMTQYAHLSRYAVKSGTRVKQGQVIGYVGSTGLSTGPHLDFRMRENGKWINPLGLKRGQSEPLPKQYREEYAQLVGRYGRLVERLTPEEAVLLQGTESQNPTLALARLDTPSPS